MDNAKILRQVRQSLSAEIGIEDAPAPMGESVETLRDGEEEDLRLMQRGADIYNVPLAPLNRLGRVLGKVRKIGRKVLKPILMRQVAYNGANARVAEVLLDRVAECRREIDRLSQRLDSLESPDEKDYDAAIDNLQQQIDRIQATQHQHKRAIERLIRERQQTTP
ncbi:hypothetical protein AY599_02035 [Leptolyngbya valderiana BDU 20041]|uniref:hypothetical protein n=1 Tax=Baaleninema simplex TaxID=2862350 RepID=UPI00034DB9CA|nr:hypothetical protein [Baaleninema simplex]MDC0834218.1 hypothetical protein [Geitlerinema sp. CS-897]OAB54941.1 hypothetical protein AY599_02035 [Leptolyngbya valderiana BDU 20041]